VSKAGKKKKISYCEEATAKDRNGACKLACTKACDKTKVAIVDHLKEQWFPARKMFGFCARECTLSCDQPDKRVAKTSFKRLFEN